MHAGDADETTYWAAVDERRLLLRWCPACAACFHFPRPFCPRCWHEDVEWRTAGGRGSVYTWTAIRRVRIAGFDDLVPYVLAVVELDEGPRMLTHVVDCAVEDVGIGMSVRLDFRPIAGRLLPVFAPTSGRAA